MEQGKRNVLDQALAKLMKIPNIQMKVKEACDKLKSYDTIIKDEDEDEIKDIKTEILEKLEDTFKDLPEDKDQQIKQDLEEIVE